MATLMTVQSEHFYRALDNKALFLCLKTETREDEVVMVGVGATYNSQFYTILYNLLFFTTYLS